MKAKILIAAVLVLVCHTSVFSQGAVMRVLSYNGPGNSTDVVTAMMMNYDGSVYVTGYSKGSSTDEDFATIKFNNTGDFLWVSRFNGTGNYTDRATAIAVDNYGNVYVTGWAHMEPLDAGDEILCGTIDYVTIKYDSYGNQMWMKVYAGPGGGDDIPSAILLDREGNVYVTGTSRSSANKEDYLTIKYNNNGVQQWVARYDGVSHDADFANAFALDGSSGVYVTGKSYKSGQMADYVTVKYNNEGIQEWTSRYNGPGNGDDIAYSIAIDVNYNSYITGTSKGTSNTDYATVKISPNGSQVWAQRYNGTGNGVDEARSLILDPYGSCYVTGFSMGTTSNYDYATLKYDPSGNQIWVQRYNGPGNGIDKAWKINLIKKPCLTDYPCWNFDLYVTGQSIGSGTGNDFCTVKYDQFGMQKWVCRYASSGSIEDISTTNAVRDDFGYLYAAGVINDNYGIVQISNRSSQTDGPMSVKGPELPKEYKLEQNFPNPFNPATTINYEVPNSGLVEINVYNMLGKQVSSLVNSYMEPGRYNVSFDASNLPSGTYVYTIKAGSYIESKKMVLIK